VITPAEGLLLLPPPLIMALAAVAILATHGVSRGVVAVLAPVLTLSAIWQVPDGPAWSALFLGYDLTPVAGGALQRWFATSFALTTLVGGWFSFRRASRHELAIAYAYAASAIGLSFAGDLISAFLYLQLMVILSTALIWSGSRTHAEAGAAGVRHAVLLLLAAVVLKVGIEGVKKSTGTIVLQALPLDGAFAWLLLAGLLVHAAAPPFSVWLTDAYPKSSAAGTLFLTMFMPKAAILLLMLCFPGVGALIGFGLAMILYGIVYGLMESDLKRLLCYALVAQLGFLLVAIGIGSDLALLGGAVFAAIHGLHFALLFMCVAAATEIDPPAEVHGSGRALQITPVTTVAFGVAAATLAGLPLTAGFLGLPAIVAAASAWQPWLGPALLGAHVGILVFAVFKPLAMLAAADREGRFLAGSRRGALLLGVALCLLPALIPAWIYDLVPYAADHRVYAPGRVVLWLALPALAAVVFHVSRRWLLAARPIRVDVDWIWRRVLLSSAAGAVDLLATARSSIERRARSRLERLQYALQRHSADDGVLSRPWSGGTTVLWVAVMLTGYVLFQYF
jgi:multicomponent Na+:H+ antiporter subunit D